MRPFKVLSESVLYGRGGKCENAEVVAELDRETKEGAKGLFAFFEKKKLEVD
jgi:hypothetical protein